MKVIKSKERYLTQIDWLKSYHSFSFGEHIYPENRGWGSLRVINEDFIAPGGYFDTHPHRDMEIISYLVKGELHHKDSAGNEYTIQAGDVQRISAGSGISHSEENSSSTQETHLMQLWIIPNLKQTRPEYAQLSLDPKDKLNQLQLIISESGVNGSISIKQDTDIYVSVLDADKELKIKTKKDKAWLQLITGTLKVDDFIWSKANTTKLASRDERHDKSHRTSGEVTFLEAGDALALECIKELSLKSLDKESHFLFFDISD